MSFFRDLRIAVRSLARARALWITVIITLALGIGANAAIFSVVCGVLLRPLANRDEDRLVYIRQSSPGTSVDNINFSVPEIQDFEARVKSISAFGDFSTITTTFTGLGLEPRTITAGVVDGRFFDVMGLKPVLGRLIGPLDDGPKADHVAVLTYRFWSTALNKDRSVLNKEIQIGANQVGSTTVPRTALVIGVLETAGPPSSPHHQN